MSYIITKQTLDSLTRFLSPIFIDEPDDTQVKKALDAYTDQSKLKELTKTMAYIIQAQDSGKHVYAEEFLLSQMKRVTTILPTASTTNTQDNQITAHSTKRPLPPDQSTSLNDKRPRLDADKSLEVDGSSSEDDTEPESDPDESDLHNEDDARRAKAEKIYHIKKPKNIRLQHALNTIPHLYDWVPLPRGYVIYVRGKDFAPDLVNDILRRTALDIGILMNYYETSTQAVVTLEDESKRQVALQALRESGKELTLEAAQYRPPVIKFEVDFPVSEEDIPKILDEIRAFNLKSFGPLITFEKFRWYKLSGTVFTVICVSVSPKIRDFLGDKGKGVFYLRGKQVLVQDYFMIRRCFGCGFIGHLVNRCKDRQNRCLKCSGPHRKNNCTSKTLRCPSCKGNHEAFTISCETFREEIQRDMNNVDYLYTKILWSPRF